MGLLDTISRFGQGVEDAFTPAGERVRNQFLRDQLVQNKFAREQETRRKSAVGSFITGASQFGLLGNLAPEQLGLLSTFAEAFPDQFAQGIAGQVFPGEGRALPADIRSLIEIGIDPRSPEGKQIILDRLTVNGGSDEALAQARLQLTLLDIDERGRKRNADELTAQQRRTGLEREIFSTLKKAEELAELNASLEGTLGETGLPAADIRRLFASGGGAVADALGFDATETKALVGKIDRFNKLSIDFAIGLIDRLRSTGNLTDQKFQAFVSSTVNPGAAPGANRLILADVMELALESASDIGLTISDQIKFQNLIIGLRNPNAVENTPGFNDLSPEEQEELRRRSGQ